MMWMWLVGRRRIEGGREGCIDLIEAVSPVANETMLLLLLLRET